MTYCSLIYCLSSRPNFKLNNAENVSGWTSPLVMISFFSMLLKSKFTYPSVFKGNQKNQMVSRLMTLQIPQLHTVQTSVPPLTSNPMPPQSPDSAVPPRPHPNGKLLNSQTLNFPFTKTSCFSTVQLSANLFLVTSCSSDSPKFMRPSPWL